MYSSYYDYGDSAALGLAAGFGLVAVLLVLAWVILTLVANWKVFTKAGQPGWASIVPFYNSYINFKIFWGNGWLFLVPLVAGCFTWIPVLGTVLWVALIVIQVLTEYKKAVAFGQGVGFTVGLVLLNPIFNMILAFGNYSYFGIPQDGFSYSQIKTKVDEHRNDASTVNYEQPRSAAQNPNVQYAQPNNNYNAQPQPVKVKYATPEQQGQPAPQSPSPVQYQQNVNIVEPNLDHHLTDDTDSTEI